MILSNQTVTENPEKGKWKLSRSDRAAETRMRILRSGVHLFARYGYEGVSVDTLVARARVNKRMVYHYFGSKAGLYRAVLTEAYRSIGEVEEVVFQKHAGVVDVLGDLIRTYFTFLRNNPDFVALLLRENLSGGKMLKELSGSKEFNEGLTKAPVLRALEDVVERGIASKELRPGLDKKHLLIHLMGICMMYFSNRFTLSRSMGMDLSDDAVLEKAIQHAADFVRNAIQSHP